MWRSVECVASALRIVYADSMAESVLDSWLMSSALSSCWERSFLVYIPWASAGHT